MLETERLRIDSFTVHDAPFVLTLLNTPAWLEFIGDRGIRTLDDARQYIQTNPMRDAHGPFGFGPHAIRLKNTHEPIGLCGLYKRPFLDAFDIGFALLPDHAGNGYGYESASALIHYGWDVLGLSRLLGVTKPTNQASIRLLRKLGMSFEKNVVYTAGEPESWLFGMDLPRP